MRNDTLYRHHKGGYYFAEDKTAIDATNESTSKFVVYRNLKGEKFVRELNEFFEQNHYFDKGFRFKPAGRYAVEVRRAGTDTPIALWFDKVPTNVSLRELERQKGYPLKAYVALIRDEHDDLGSPQNTHKPHYLIVGELLFQSEHER